MVKLYTAVIIYIINSHAWQQRLDENETNRGNLRTFEKKVRIYVIFHLPLILQRDIGEGDIAVQYFGTSNSMSGRRGCSGGSNPFRKL